MGLAVGRKLVKPKGGYTWCTDASEAVDLPVRLHGAVMNDVRLNDASLSFQRLPMYCLASSVDKYPRLHVSIWSRVSRFSLA